MNRHRFGGLLSIVFLACASRTPIPALPYCAESDDAWRPPDPACQAEEDFVSFRSEIERLVAPQAGPLLVRIRLDDDARIADACVVRGYGGGQWSARRRLAETLVPPATSSSGPACSAGTGLELNRARATYELIKILERDCQRQSISFRQFTECLDMWQRRRGEIWVYGSKPRYRVFLPTPEPSARRAALLACTERNPASGSETLPPFGIARVGVDLGECMKAQGWNELE